MSLVESTSIEEEANKNRFQVFEPSFPYWGEPVVRLFCKLKQGIPVRVNPTQKDKFKYTQTYKLYPNYVEGRHIEPSEYLVIKPSDLPKGNYLFIVTDSEEEQGDHVLILSRVYSNDIELGSRHSIMPDKKSSPVYSAGELIKWEGSNITFNFKSFTFGDPLVARVKENNLKKGTLEFLTRIFPGTPINYNKFAGFQVSLDDLAISEQSFEKACSSMQKFDSLEERNSLKDSVWRSDICIRPEALREHAGVHELPYPQSVVSVITN